MKKLEIHECFRLDPEAVEVIESVWKDPANAPALNFLEEKLFAAEIPVTPKEMPWSGELLGKLMLTAAVTSYPRAVERYRQLGWPLEFLNDTMLDLQIWSRHHKENFGTWGLIWDAAAFIRTQLQAGVIRFGRLQCNTFYPLWKELNDPAGKWTLAKGTQVINLHIPASGPMKIGDCLESMERMREFYRVYRPEIDWQAFICHSWLLDTQLQNLLPETSNIIQFQKLGTIIGEPEKEADTIFRVFGTKAVKEGVASVHWTTSMQKILGKFVLDGGKFHPGWMVIPRD